MDYQFSRSQELPKAFLSYSRSSEGSVQQICDDLKRCGIDEVWWDKRLVGAQSWWDTILHQIRDADVVVCLLDVGMPESTAVRREYQYAIDLGKPLLPMLLSSRVEISTLPIELAGKHYVDYRPGNPDALSDLAGALRSLPPASELPNPLPPEPPIPISERDYLIEKVSSTEPLTQDIQVDVLNRLRRLERSDDNDQRQFAQTSLKRFRNRPELLASVADDMDAGSTLSQKSRGAGSGLAVAGVLVALLVAGFLYLRFTADDKPDHASGVTTISSGVNESAGGGALGKSGSQVEGQDNLDTVSTAVSEVESLTTYEAVPVVKDQPEAPAQAEQFSSEGTSPKLVDVKTGKSDESTDDALIDAAPAAVTETNDQRVNISLEVGNTEPVEMDWDVDFAVFEDTLFDLCGFKKFTAVVDRRVGAELIDIRSADRSIPDQPFRGLQKQIGVNQVFEILPGCRILLSSETTSGVSRIRVRAKGAR